MQNRTQTQKEAHGYHILRACIILYDYFFTSTDTSVASLKNDAFLPACFCHSKAPLPLVLSYTNPQYSFASHIKFLQKMNSFLCALINVIIGSFQDQMPRISAHIKRKSTIIFYPGTWTTVNSTTGQEISNFITTKHRFY